MLDVDPHRAAALRRQLVGARDHRAVGQQVVDLDERRRARRVGEEDVLVEERAGGALGEEPAERRRGDRRRGVAGQERGAGPIQVHRALDGDVLGGRDGRRDVAAGQAGDLVQPDRVAAARRHAVVADDRRVGRRPQEAHVDRGGPAAGVLQQVEQVERPAGGALGEEPLPAGRGDGRLRVAADAVPRHHAIGADGDVRVDLDAELGAADAEVRGGERAAGARGDRQRQAADRAVGEERRHEDVRVGRVRVGERQLPGEERVRRALGQPAREAPARMRAGEELGAVAGAVAVGIIVRAVGRRRRLGIEAERDLPGVRQRVRIRVGHGLRRRCRSSRGEQGNRSENKDESAQKERIPLCAIDTFCRRLHSTVPSFTAGLWPPPGLLPT